MRSIPYWELNVYSLAFQSAMLVYDFTRQWPEEEKLALVNQIRRSSRLVCILIAQAWNLRKTAPDNFIMKINDAAAQVTETMVWLDFSVECGYLKKSDHEQLLINYDDIGMTLSHMMSEPDNWR